MFLYHNSSKNWRKTLSNAHRENYFAIRSELISNELAHIVAIERQYMNFLVDVTLRAADSIYTDFCQVTELMPFWGNCLAPRY